MDDENMKNVSPAATLFVVSAVQFLTPYMMSAVGVALPTIGREFQASAVHLGLIEMIYILAVALLLLPAGRFADIHGRRKVFIAGTVLITISTLALGLSENIRLFILFRFLQGAGAAMITSTSVAILSAVFPPERRGRAMGVIVACVYIGLSVGPTLSGLIISHIGWRWIFYISVPVEITALVLILTKLKGEWAEAKGESFDWAGSLIYMVSLFGLIYGTTQLESSVSAKWCLLAGLLLFVIFLYYESKTDSPVLDVNLLITNREFSFSNIATCINYAASFGVIFYLSIYLQSVKGFSPRMTGLILIIQPVIQAFMSPLSGRLSDKYPPERIATIGMILCVAGLYVASTIKAGTGLAVINSAQILLGIGFGFFSTPNMTAIMGSVGPRHYGVASSIVATMRSVGMLVSMAIITIVLNVYLGNQAIGQGSNPAFISSMRMSFVIFSFLGLVGILFSLGRLNLNFIRMLKRTKKYDIKENHY